MSEPASIRDFDSPADRIKAHRQADSRGVLLVEGPADKRLLTRVASERLVAFICGTRNNVKEVLSRTRDIAVDRVAGLIDRDFDDYYEMECSPDPLMFTFSGADLEAHLIEGPWFEDLLEEIASIEKVQALGGMPRVREMVTYPARCVGLLRRGNAVHGWGVDFVQVDFLRKVNSQTLELDVDGLKSSVRGRLTRDHADTFAEVCRAFGRVGDDDLYRGKDALSVLSKGLARAIATTRGVEPTSLEAALRLSADGRLLASTPFNEICTALDGSGK